MKSELDQVSQAPKVYSHLHQLSEIFDIDSVAIEVDNDCTFHCKCGKRLGRSKEYDHPSEEDKSVNCDPEERSSFDDESHDHQEVEGQCTF